MNGMYAAEANRSTPEVRVITLREAAEYLHVSYSTVYRMVHSGDLGAYRIRGVLRTSTALCDEYLASASVWK